MQFAQHRSHRHARRMAKPSKPAKRPQASELEVERSIHFFRIDAGADESAIPTKLDLSPALKKINELPFTHGGGRYLPRNEVEQCMWVDRVDEISRVSFGSVRRGALPQTEAAGRLEA